MSTTIPATIPATGTFAVDPVHSSVGFSVRHMVVATFRSSFSRYDARLTLGEGEPRLEGTVEAASVEVADENLKGHLLSPEFFDADRNPQLRFTSKRFDISEDGTVSVTGDLEIKGHVEEVEAAGTISYVEADMGGGERIGLALETSVDRTRYGLNWNAPLPKGGFALADEVKLSVELGLTRTA